MANYYKFDLENSVNKSLSFKNSRGSHPPREGVTPFCTYPHSALSEPTV